MSPSDALIFDKAQSLPDWELHEFRQDGRLVFFSIIKGTEIHCHLCDGIKLRRKEAQEFFRPLFERNGCLTTRIEHGDEESARLNKVFGFEPTWSDEKYQYSLMAKLPFTKEQQCQ